MNKIITWSIGIAAGLALILSIGNMVGDNNQPAPTPIVQTFGAEGTRFPNGASVNSTISPTANGLILGQSGTENTKFLSGNCTGVQPTATFAASSTQEWICAVTGVTADDKVFAELNNADFLATEAFGFVINSVRATTSGFIGVRVANMTGGASTTVSADQRSINYWIAD
jgi:hypothetical protein